MAGTFKKFIGGIAFESLSTYTGALPTGTEMATPPYKQTNGTARTGIGTNRGTSNEDTWRKYNQQLAPYFNLTAKATADVLADYDINDYQVVAVGTTTTSKTRQVNSTGATTLYTVTITAGAEDITVGCIKFTKQVTENAYTSTQYDVLVCGYYLETPITITAGTSQTINVAFTVGEMSAIS